MDSRHSYEEEASSLRPTNSCTSSTSSSLGVPKLRLSCPDVADDDDELEEDDDGIQDDTRSGTGMEEILEAWKMYVEQEEETPEIKNEEEGKDEDGLV